MKIRKLPVTISATILLSVAPIVNPIIQSATSVTVHADDTSSKDTEYLKDSTDVLKQSKVLMQKTHDMKNKILAARSTLMAANNNISNVTIKVANLQSKKADKEADIKQTESDIKDLKDKIKDNQKEINKLYSAEQLKNNKTVSGLNLDNLDPAKQNQTNSFNSALKDVLKSNKKELKANQGKLRKLQAKKNNQKQDAHDINDEIDVAKTKKDKLESNIDNDSFVKNSFDPSSIQEVKDLQNELNDLQQKFENVSNSVIDNNSKLDNNALKKIKKQLKNSQSNIDGTTKDLNGITGQEADSVDVDIDKINDSIAKIDNNQNTTATNDNGNDTIIAPTSTSNSATANQIVKEALGFVGVPYVWGGTTPSGFDCSGLVQYVYRDAGISLPRVSQAQSTMGQPVSLSNLQPGDLLFWGGVGTAHHVAIYIGNQEFVQAPEPGQNVKVTKLSWYTPDFARRVL